tara:strand:+ start:5620 stop:5823 length:204 start_codon:yes stop_codon:yes gene_type:complete
MSLIPVEGHSSLYRDSDTGAIVNTDDSSYHAYLRQKNAKKSEKEELDEMKKDIDDIKKMLSKIVEKL